MILFFSCNAKKDKAGLSPLQQWIIDHHVQLEDDIRDAIKNNEAGDMKNSPDWVSASVVTTMYSPNSLGQPAKNAGDSTKCIVVKLTYHKDERRKKELMITATDSRCLAKLNSITLKTDSIGNLIFGKDPKPIE